MALSSVDSGFEKAWENSILSSLKEKMGDTTFFRELLINLNKTNNQNEKEQLIIKYINEYEQKERNNFMQSTIDEIDNSLNDQLYNESEIAYQSMAEEIFS